MGYTGPITIAPLASPARGDFLWPRITPPPLPLPTTMDTMRRIKVAAVTVTVVALTACGTGGYSGAEPPADDGINEEADAAAADEEFYDRNYGEGESSTEPLDEPEPEPLPGLPHAATIDELKSADVMEVDSIYASLVRTAHPDQTADLSDDEITTIGHDACMAFDDGATVDDVMADTVAAGVDAETGAYIVGGGLAVYCAEWLGMLGLE